METPSIFRLRRVFQTQTVLIVAPLMREETHRVIRKYRKYKDYFFRLTLVTENQSKLHFGERMKNILAFMITVLGKGVHIGDHGSAIVNYSNSQLKNHSVWMLVKTDFVELQIDKIIELLGKFNASEGLLKMFARRGQCFTTTKFITKLEAGDIRKIDDVKRPRTDGEPGENYTFTDGCGRISPALAHLIDEKFNLHYCSAYQVRLGGAKGVLVRYDNLNPDDTGEEKYVELRPS